MHDIVTISVWSARHISNKTVLVVQPLLNVHILLSVSVDHHLFVFVFASRSSTSSSTSLLWTSSSRTILHMWIYHRNSDQSEERWLYRVDLKGAREVWIKHDLVVDMPLQEWYHSWECMTEISKSLKVPYNYIWKVP